MVFITENWFWRGTQSAIFYYASCTPWREYKHKRKRRRDAAESRGERRRVIDQQPGLIPQPAPFETNEDWTEEILRGPHPPKGWKKDPIYYKYMKKMKAVPEMLDFRRAEAAPSTSTPVRTTLPALSPPNTPLTPTTSQGPHIVIQDGTVMAVPPVTGDNQISVQLGQLPQRARSVSDLTLSVRRYGSSELSSTAVDSRPSCSPFELTKVRSASSVDSDTTRSKRMSTDSVARSEKRSQASRPSMDRRLSSAVDTFKDAVRTTLHPDKWNWIRYERDDEVLSNLNDKVKSMWVSVKGQANSPNENRDTVLERIESKKRVDEWQRGKHPAINDMHPPVVSQLPYTPEEAKWMLLPPPSADVMMGRSRPDPFDDFHRKPLSVIGRAEEKTLPERQPRVSVVSSEEDETDAAEAEDSSDEEWFMGMSYLQKPQRAHLRKQRLSAEV